MHMAARLDLVTVSAADTPVRLLSGPIERFSRREADRW
jgi:hypothetical protein